MSFDICFFNPVFTFFFAETKIVDKRGFTTVCRPYIVLIALVANFSYLTSALLTGNFLLPSFSPF